MGKKLSVIILNWNNKKMTKECLQSLLPQIKKDFEVIVVDNASTDGSVKYLKKAFPNIKIIESPENLGYAGGNNLGVKHSCGKYILILNNDLIVADNFLTEIWKNRNKADILGVKNYYYDEKNILWSVGSTMNKLTMKASLIGNKERDGGQYDKLFNPPQISGSAMMINRKVIDRVGFLDKDYFCYYEETEWQTRSQNAGFKISWIPSAKLWHKVGFSTGGGKTPASAYYLVRNRGYFIKKWSQFKIIAWFGWGTEIFLRFFYGLFHNKRYSKMAIRGAIDFLKGKKGKLD